MFSVVWGRGRLCVPLQRWCAGKWFHRGIRAAGGRRVMRARLVFWRSGASMGANAVDKNSTFCGFFFFFQNKRAPFPHEKNQLTLKLHSSEHSQTVSIMVKQPSERVQLTPHTDSPSHNGSSVQLDLALHLPDFTGFWLWSQSS